MFYESYNYPIIWRCNRLYVMKGDEIHLYSSEMDYPQQERTPKS